MKLTEKQINHLESVSDEINLYLGLKSQVIYKEGKNDQWMPGEKIQEGFIKIDTIAGELLIKPMYKDVMLEVYRCIKLYGSKIHRYAQKTEIEIKKKLSKKNNNQPKP